MAAFEAWLVFLILVVNVVGELQLKRTLAASRGFLAAARLSCQTWNTFSRRKCCFLNHDMTFENYPRLEHCMQSDKVRVRVEEGGLGSNPVLF